ncbi:MAG: hypothetical protein K2G64_06795, partial [Muribaculaceae bacterium]|nr:hypothetical protein [Muribaculaceae bacterium]
CGCDDGIYSGYDEDEDGSAWAISPAITLKGATDYIVNIYMKGLGGADDLRIMAAEENTISALEAGTECFDVKGFSTSSLTKQTGSFTPAADGDYYFGVNCYTAADENNYGVIATGFTISYEQTSGVSVVVADENGVMEYFDLQGRKVETPSTGLYICRQGDNVKKVVIK